MTHLNSLQRLEAALDDLSSGRGTVADLARTWRAEADLLAALPERYQRFADQHLMQLESASLFTEESCSFSQRDLLDGLRTWVAKARTQLA
jgi:hypothetical protein